MRSSQTITAMAPIGMAITKPITSSSMGPGIKASNLFMPLLYPPSLPGRKWAVTTAFDTRWALLFLVAKIERYGLV